VRHLKVIVYAILLGFLQAAPAYAAPAYAATVNAEDYSSFWIWGGVKSQPVLSLAKSIYVLQGRIAEIKAADKTRTLLVAQGMPVARIRNSQVWLTYRADTLHWPPDIMPAILSRLKQWQQSGNPVAGIQIDFDAGTRHLHKYASFLKQVRDQLPPDYRLSITGLLDWSSNGDIKTINGMSTVIDEIIIQTYQGRKSITNYTAYLPALKHLTVPFKIGLVQNGEWQEPKDLGLNRWFGGYVVFLLNQHPP
jgi:hypothetical protein